MICENCGAKHLGWQGQCSVCGEWGTIVKEDMIAEISAVKSNFGKSKKNLKAVKPKKLSQIPKTDSQKIPSGISELDRALGEGLMPGSVILLTGEPGIGKSTLLLQLGAKWSVNKNTKETLYISAEESLGQIRSRGDRIEGSGDVDLLNIYTLEQIEASIRGSEADLLVIDSIQTIYSLEARGLAGGVSQVKHCAAHLVALAKSLNKTMIIVGHINKEGTIAGPKILEHLVDVVLNFAGEKDSNLRLLRSQKNRFGPTDEVGIFAMEEKGLISVANPGEYFLEQSGGEGKRVGVAKSMIMEGQRPLVIEVQSLAVPTSFAYPKRVSEGVSVSKLQLIIAVMSKYLKLKLNEYDVYVKVSQGFKTQDPAIDLGLALSLYSSVKNIPHPSELIAYGEISLTGQVLPVTQASKRSKESRALGYKTLQSSKPTQLAKFL
ncbi:MAG: DNA repair protein RadA [Candidatus Dojkabacteria bacterium]